MAYIGNAKTPLLLATNVRDDLIPDKDNSGNWKKTFTLSQEIPGGDEANVTVVRRRWITDVLVENSDKIQVSGTTLTVTDKYLAASLSIIQPKSADYDGDILSVKIGSASTFIDVEVLSVSYSIDEIQIGVDKTISSNGQSLSVYRGYYAAWEILDSKIDYKIEGAFGTALYHKQITLNEAPQVNDVVYVLHRGDATYNLMPSPGSVGLHQLSDNLKTFTCNRGVGDGTTTDFEISQSAINEKSLLVTVDGLVKEGDDKTNEYVGDWELVTDTQSNTQKVRFHDAPSAGQKVQILHLGFVAGLRRASFAPGQEPATLSYHSILEEKLADESVSTRTIIPGAVATSKIQNNAVTTSKILLDASHNEGIRTQYSDGIKNLVGVVNQTSTEVYTKSDVLLNFSDQSNISLSQTEVKPSVTNAVSLGASNNKFKNLHLAGEAQVGQTLTVQQGVSVAAGGASIVGAVAVTGALSITGTTTLLDNVSVSGNIAMVHPQSGPKKTVDGVVISDLKDAFDALVQKVSTLIPVGTIMLSGKSSPQTQDGVWLVCDGSSLSTTDYPDLHAAIGYAFGGSGSSFSLPDLRRRVPIGKSASDNLGDSDALALADRKLVHSHTGAPHTHDLSNHTHTLPAHNHSVTASSTIQISESGQHTTNINHQHKNIVTGSALKLDTATNTYVTATLSHTHSIEHSHIGNLTVNNEKLFQTRAGGEDHVHTGTTNTDGAHTHAHRGKIGDSGVHPVGQYFRVTGGYASTYPSTVDAILDSDGSAHRHAFTTGGAKNSVTGAAAFSHQHYFTIPTGATPNLAGAPTSGIVNGTTINNELVNHSHSFTTTDLPAAEAIVSGGTHTHPTSSFSGLIGNAEDLNGNTQLTSGTPSTNATGGAVFVGNTGETAVPYAILNYVIKAKNS